ncbi:MAG: hypothetical protein FWF90_13845 [Promicromonosporaceae bacterium]|nr:hypothetical protein [Promicromonosporaceae bacterium]
MPSLVVIPATPLLLPGSAGRADPLAGLRDVVRDVVVSALDDAGPGPVAVLGTGPVARAGRLRPTLAAAGIADPEPAPRAPVWEADAATGPSVALLVLADAGRDPASVPVDVVEVPGDAPTAVVLAAAQRLRSAALVVVADHPAPGVDAVLTELTAVGPWTSDVTDVPAHHEHLPATYRVTVHRRRTVGA